MSLKLNLGCGPDVREGYVNVDFNERPGVENVDLSILPWKWEDDSVEEILMLDILEHFPYNMTDAVLTQCWRVLKVGGRIEIQVPDFEHCAFAAMGIGDFMCNVCGAPGKQTIIKDGEKCCMKCGTPSYKIAEAAIHRLYGGQDFEGNWHFNAFTKQSLARKLETIGFKDIKLLEKHHQFLNWNFKISAIKDQDVW